MSEWKRIAEIADVRRGASPRPIGDPKYFGGEVGWIRISDVTRASRFLRETEQYVSPLGESLSVRVKPGDLVMSICGTLGRPIIIDIPACIHDGFVQFSNLREADTTFLFYALQHSEPAFNGMGQPGTQTNLNTGLVGRHRIFAPCVSEQRRIAEILSTVDEAIEQTEALVGKWQQMKAGLMHDLFTRGVTPEGHLRPTRTQAPHLYQDSPLGWIPKEWEVSCCAAEFAIDSGITLGPHRRPNKSPHPYLRVANVHRDRLVLDDVAQLEAFPGDVASGSLKTFDLLVVEGHANRNEIGRCAMVLDDAEGMLFQNHLFRLRPTKLKPRFALLWLNSFHSARYWESKCATSSGLNTINRKLLGAMPVLLPPPDEQVRLVELAFTHRDRLASETTHLAKLRQQKQGLMHDLLTGRVRVDETKTSSSS